MYLHIQMVLQFVVLVFFFPFVSDVSVQIISNIVAGVRNTPSGPLTFDLDTMENGIKGTCET